VAWLIATVLVLSTTARAAFALDYRERPSWMVGVGWGFGRGNFTEGTNAPEPFSGSANDWQNGAVPSIRFGRMLNERFMLGLNWADWLIEYGESPVKYRRTLQTFALSLAIYPGSVNGPSNGIYLRAGGGVGWAGSGEKEAREDTKQHRGARKDEWGYSVLAEAGYEFWITPKVTTGVNVGWHHVGIDDEIVNEASFGSTGFVLQVYF